MTALVEPDAASEAAEAPLTLFQAARYIDEEVLLAFCEDGLEIPDCKAFLRLLPTEQTLLDRMVPVAHGLCLVRCASLPPLTGRAELSGFYARIDEEGSGPPGFLLYRRGNGLWRIDSPLLSEGIDCIFPAAPAQEDVADLDEDAVLERKQLADLQQKLVFTTVRHTGSRRAFYVAARWAQYAARAE